MNPQTPEIAELLILVENKYARNLKTTTDFEEFSLLLSQEEGMTISPSTLKRLWGYVGDSHTPRTCTLDVLSRYIGHPRFVSFCKYLKTSPYYNSSFFSTPQILLSDLKPLAQIEIGWSPNRRLLLRYEGEALFSVLESENSKLRVSDQFEAVSFLMGQPLYLPYVKRGEERLPAFIAGRNSGLTLLKKI